jgi:hypothetical protein
MLTEERKREIEAETRLRARAATDEALIHEAADNEVARRNAPEQSDQRAALDTAAWEYTYELMRRGLTAT